ncbi:MAG: FAD-dependent monooxygenase [Calditrichaeota bacterium]|nr:FAD-dependent monooxygenase [Calditrichota bacterium]
MKPAGKSELESLYFDYPHFEFKRPLELDGQSTRHPVVIAGAGPVGLTAALELARRGIASVLLDKNDTLNEGSRAICISRYSFETLQQLGLTEPFANKSLGWTHGRCYYRNKMIYRLEMPHSEEERFLPMYNIQQPYIEQFLVDKASEYPQLIDMRWQSEVVSVGNSAQGVELTVKTPAGEYPLRAEYLLAADGGKSSIRKMLGLRMNGDNLPGNYVIADIRMDHDFPTERRSFFESEANPNATILIHKEPDNIWRVDWQILDDEDPGEAIEEKNIRGRIQAILDMIGHTGPWELEWWSIYTANTLCLDDYRHERVLFIGDAAHIVPIFGVRGLNNGFADAVNAAWKLAYVINGEAQENILDSYSPERRGATLDVFRNAGKSSRFMTPPTRGYELMRKAVLELSLSQEFTRQFADPRQVQPYTYSDSPITSVKNRDAAMTDGPNAGSAAINRKISADDYLLDHIGLGFTGLYFSDQERIPTETLELFTQLREADKNFTPLVISRKSLHQEGLDVIEDTHGNIFDGYGAQGGTFYLLRPDRHVTARWISIKTEEVRQALHTALGGTN